MLHNALSPAQMKNLEIFDNENLLKKVLAITEKSYRPYDPGWYLYKLVSQYNRNKYSHEFIELVYATLSAWNMNSRGAKLNDFDLFKKSIIKNKILLEYFTNKSIKDIVNNDIQNNLKKYLSKDWNLCETKVMDRLYQIKKIVAKTQPIA